MTFTRRTLALDAAFEGMGLHSGEPVRAVVHPGESGITFRCGVQVFGAMPQNVTDTTRSTRLGSISTIEHLMSALAGLEITEAEVEVEGGELPALDGSAALYLAGLSAAGTVDLGSSEVVVPFERVFMQGPQSVAVSAGSGHWRYAFVNPDRWPFRQVFETPDVARDYGDEIAPARTFGFAEDLPAIEAAGLAKGLDLQSALLLGASGYLNNERFADEPARHKLLDAIGDLYLAGVPIRLLNVTAERSGHRANVEAAALIRQQTSRS